MGKPSQHIPVLGAVYAACLLVASGCSTLEEPLNIEPSFSAIGAGDLTRTSATLWAEVSIPNPESSPTISFSYTTTGSDTVVTGYRPCQDPVTALHVEGLEAGTQYQLRATISGQTASVTSGAVTFSTLPNTAPVLGKASIVAFSPVSVIAEGTVTDHGGDPAITAGAYLLTKDVYNSARMETTCGPDGKFRIFFGHLDVATHYRLVPFAANAWGETTGDTLAFSTPDAIAVTEPGTLATLLKAQKLPGDTVRISGALDGSDFAALRATATSPKLTLDISGVSVVPGGDAYDGVHQTRTDVISTGLLGNWPTLASVVLPITAVTIERDAFVNSRLTSLNFPASVKTIQPSLGCSRLSAIEVTPGNDAYNSAEGVLYDQALSQLIWYPAGRGGDFTISPGTRKIGETAFAGSGVTTITGGENLTTIGPSAFQNCSELTVLNLGAKVDYIGAYAFGSTQLQEITLQAVQPPYVESTAFGNAAGDVFAECLLRVPDGTRDIYRLHNQWGRFRNIIEMK